MSTLLVERRTLVTAIYDALRDKIVSLAFKPGEMIFENAIAAEFEVSRTPIRQALSMLAQEDLIEVLPQRGARVAYLSVVKLTEAQYVRESLESSAFASVAAHWDSTNPLYGEAEKRILAVIDGQKAAVDKQDYLGFMHLDAEYHEQILRLLGNSTLMGVVYEMRLHLNRLRYLELQDAHHEKLAIEHHMEIFDAIRSNDVAATTEMLRSHLQLLEDFREGIYSRHRELFADKPRPFSDFFTGTYPAPHAV